MKDDPRRGPRPIPVTDAVRDLIRKAAADRAADIATPATPDRAADVAMPATPDRSFAADGHDWIAKVAGEGVAGTGAFAAAALVAIRFHAADDPARPRREAIIPRGLFERLHDDELVALLRTARPLDPDGD
ncbi:MAG TPA: hypothetical protein VF158_13590 [Longimicrobiales bacterium]